MLSTIRVDVFLCKVVCRGAGNHEGAPSQPYRADGVHGDQEGSTIGVQEITSEPIFRILLDGFDGRERHGLELLGTSFNITMQWGIY